MDDRILAPVDKEDPTSHMPSAGLGALIGVRSGNLVAGEQGFPEFFTSPRLSAHAATWPSLSFPPRVYYFVHYALRGHRERNSKGRRAAR